MHFWRRALIFSILIATLAFAHGCGGPTYVVQQYSGDPRSRETIAVIRVNGNEAVLLDSLDSGKIGVQVPQDSRLFVEVLPGPHRVGIVNANDMGAPRFASFRAEAGKFYRPVLLVRGALLLARVYEVDSESDTLLRDVTLTAPAKAPAPPETTPVEAPSPAPPEPPADAPLDPSSADAGLDAAAP
jgi:hypothetical protein